MEEAIKKAIEGGWKPNEIDVSIMKLAEIPLSKVLAGWRSRSIILLDPLFWQALGKAEGWKERQQDCTAFDTSWTTEWHRFIDHLAAGKDVDSFFKDLLKLN